MKPKVFVTGLLLLFVLGSVVFLVAQKTAPPVAGHGAAVPSPEPAAPAPAVQVVAHYFHGRARCTTCRLLEAYAREAVETGFAQELADGRLSWRTVDISQPENRHFIREYQLQFQSVVLVETREGQPGRWQNLDQIWDLVSDKERYQGYVRDLVRAFLAKTAAGQNG